MKALALVAGIVVGGVGLWGGFGTVYGALQPAPDVTFKDLQGKQFRLADYRGKVVIVNFWAEWCPPCKIEIPHLVSLYNKYKDQGLMIFGVAIDSKNDEVIRKKAQELGVNYPVVNGDNERARVRRSFPPIRGVPASFIINKQGMLYSTHTGFNPQIVEQIEAEIKTLLAEEH
jgi:thiol-disulfide isomerase/thioredoxin